MQCFEDDLVTQQLLEFGAHTRPELAFLSSLVTPGDRVFDLGAHIGTFAIPLARRVGPEGSVIAVEADPGNFELLTANVAANDVTGIVTPVCTVLAPSRSQYKPARERRNTGATRFVRPRWWERVRSDPSSGIDEVAETWGKQPDVIKIDIEGLELGVLEASDIVREVRPIIYAEVSASHLERYSATVEAFDRFFRNLGYRLFKNIGERNAAHDEFEVIELGALRDGGTFFDVLAVPSGSSRLPLLAKAMA